MVTEVEEKGRGLVAARDIKMGEEILLDNTVIILDIPDGVITPTIARLFKQQIQALSDEESTQFYNLKTVDNIVLSSRDLKILRRENCLRELKIFRSNKFDVFQPEFEVLFHNLALINHSCAPNADFYLKPEESADETKVKFELRAIKDICKGEEITIFYLHFNFGILPKLMRQTKLKDKFGFDCKCSVCCGKADDQDELTMKLFKLCSDSDLFRDSLKSKKYHCPPDEWKKFAIKEGLVLAVSQDLYIGNLNTKIVACYRATIASQMARDPVIRGKALAVWKELVMKTGFEQRKADFKEIEEMVAKWSPQFDHGIPPTKEEIDSFNNFKL